MAVSFSCSWRQFELLVYARGDRPVQWRFLWLVIPFFLLWTVERSLQSEMPAISSDFHLHLALVEFLKLSVCLAVYGWRRKYGAPSLDSQPDGNQCYRNEEQPLYAFSQGDHQEPVQMASDWRSTPAQPLLRLGSARSMFSVLGLAVLHAVQNYVAYILVVFDPLTSSVATAMASLLSLFILRIFFSRFFSLIQCQAILLQLSGLIIIRNGLMNNFRSTSYPSYSFLFMSVLSTALALTSTDLIYQAHQLTSPNIFNLRLFAIGCSLHMIVYAFKLLLAAANPIPIITFEAPAILLAMVQAGIDIIALSILFYHGAVAEGVLSGVASVLVVLRYAMLYGSMSLDVFAGCLMTAVASSTYFLRKLSADDRATAEGESKGVRRWQSIGAGCLSVVTAIYIGSVLFGSIHEVAPETAFTFSSISSTTPEHNLCQRKLPPFSYPEASKQYDKFQDVLLIVFFSHARYDVNLDYYREVYSDFFPNMLFVGPASREDAGFAHSYDVLVDSYESEEDLTDPSFYKMAGRMAHHMLYTALKGYDCYDGYLWAPFDTLLNVPRLEQFDQNFFWYHSPWATYVPNPALRMNETANATKHAPPANVSPDPALDLTENWRGWGLDWWWGDPHVGVAVCMEAFRKVPLELQERMAVYTNGTTRLIGGSADTLYIPGRHRKTFMDVLGLFLETNCFLEIATPTTVHLVAHPDEPMLFVDHWWIYTPPFNASFVRQKWAEGYEVDTFHTFHWGDVGPDGVWRGNHDHVADVRHLLVESARRQDLDFDFLIK